MSFHQLSFQLAPEENILFSQAQEVHMRLLAINVVQGPVLWLGNVLIVLHRIRRVTQHHVQVTAFVVSLSLFHNFWGSNRAAQRPGGCGRPPNLVAFFLPA